MKSKTITSNISLKTIPRVSIVCISYNQEEYITQTIESFVTQKTSFPFEIIIADDASTDKTADIVRTYEKQYPELFHNILRIKNMGAQPNMIAAMQAATGEYIAICEGDDYWADPLKLQKQVDFLDTHKEHSIVFHPVRVFFQNHEEEDTLFPDTTDSKYFTVKNLLKSNYIQTNSVMYRRMNYDHLPSGVMPFDWYLHLIHAKGGKIGFINEVMSAYRRHMGGVWWNQRSNPQSIWKKYGYQYLKLLHEIMLVFGGELDNRKIIDKHIAGSYEAIASVKPTNVGDDLATKAVAEMPIETWDYMKFLMQQIDHYSKHDAYLQGVLDSKENDILFYQQKISKLSDELSNIKSSKSWKTIHIVRHPIKSVQRLTRPTSKNK